MLSSKRVQAILSLVIAVALWMFVMGTVDPQITYTVRSIPVEKINEDVLEELNLSATLEKPETVDVQLRGKRSDVNEAKKGKIRATVDVSNCDYGKNEAEINIVLPDKVTGVIVDDISYETAIFTVK